MSQPTLLLDAMHVLDRVDTALAQTDQRREDLIQLVTQTCEKQQVKVAPELIAEAVDSQLNPSTALQPAKKTAFDFGWNRPTSLAALDRRDKRYHGWFRSHMRHLVDVFHYHADEGPKLGWSVVYGLLTSGLLTGAVTALFHNGLASGLTGVLSLFLSALLWGVTGALQSLGRALGGEKAHKALQEAMPRQYELENWAKNPETRAYARQCFLSGVPYFLQEDVERLQAIQQDLIARQKEEGRVRQRLEMQAMFFMANEAPTATPTRPSR